MEPLPEGWFIPVYWW